MYGALLLIFLPLLSLAQKKDTTARYLDEELRLTTKKNAVYYGVSMPEADHWMLYAVYPDTTTLVKAYYKDRELKIKDGPYFFYYPKNRIARRGFFTNNEMHGVWQTWFENGQKKDSGLIRNNQMVGEWKTWFENGNTNLQINYRDLDQDAMHKVLSTVYGSVGKKEGSFRSWYPNGLDESIGQFKNDLMEGTWKWYHEKGMPSTIEVYKEGKLLSMECFDTTGSPTGDFCAVSRAAVLQGFGDYKQYVYQNLQWPDEAIKKRIEGVVRIHFRVNKKGELEILSTTGKTILCKAVRDLFKQMKLWYPAVSHNREIDWEDEMSIPFYLNN